MVKRIISVSLTLVLLLNVMPGNAFVQAAQTGETGAVEETAIPIHTPQQLQQISENPEGSYILMEDLDMTGFEWKPVEFFGSFDGNGHAILNLELTQAGEQMATTYDGNEVPYETQMVALFSIIRNAKISNLKLLNVRGCIQTDEHCFLAALAGYSEKSTIADCVITGTLELRAHNRMFGVAGVVGFSSAASTVERCTVDVTLISTDTDSQRRDEQFLGGVLGVGIMDIRDCHITIDGYISEFGYVHSGGIIGMSLPHPVRPFVECQVTGNTVTGKITFFECNSNRRAYCDAYVGEELFGCNTKGCKNDFVRDERWEYDVELRPEMCAEPVYTETVVPGGCDTYGYTKFECQRCGYTYTDDYTFFAHTVTNWTVTEAPTTEAEGLSTGYCDGCGLEFTRAEEKLEPTLPPTEAPTEAQTEPVEVVVPEETAFSGWWVFIIAAAVVVTGACLINAKRRQKAGKYEKARSE